MPVTRGVFSKLAAEEDEWSPTGAEQLAVPPTRRSVTLKNRIRASSLYCGQKHVSQG